MKTTNEILGNSNVRVLSTSEQKNVIGGVYETGCESKSRSKCEGPCSDDKGHGGTCVWALDPDLEGKRCRCAIVYVG